MAIVSANPRVPARLVLTSLVALWACYFLVATLRGAFLGFDFAWPIISRRLTICILSILVMAAVWPLLQMLDRKSNTVRMAVVLVGALPLALVLSIINDVVFSDLKMAAVYGDEREAEAMKAGNVLISRDEAGNILVDLPNMPSVPAPPPVPEASEGTATAAPPQPSSSQQPVPGITIRTDKLLGQEYGRWAAIADTAFGRYFLVLAWVALYFALAKAEEARAAERREGEYRRAAEAAELRSLRYQVNPHFLFNTLNSLSALVMTDRRDDAETMIQTLSTFYRHTLSGDPTTDIALVDEIEMQQLYLKIEAVRFPNRLLTKIDVDDAVRDAKVPGMILQPLVENSVKYAVAATQRPVTIGIKVRRDGRDLLVMVSDDGPGAPASKADGCGIGMRNVRDRLRARYGDAAQITFGQQPEGGFATVLRIPLELGRGG